MTLNPCDLNIYRYVPGREKWRSQVPRVSFSHAYSLCPLNASQPITAWASIPVGPEQIGNIPDIAFSIPDFEGSTTLQIFSNSSETEIGCFQAVMRNGATFSHPEAVAPILGTFTAAAIVASFLTAAYGVSTTHRRIHYAHSLSVFAIIETFQSIFFSGAVSVNWPSVLIGWWSNFAWSAGQIYVPDMITALDGFTGVSGNASQVGGAGSVVINNGGGLVTQIYGRAALSSGETIAAISKRSAYNASDPYDYTWAGNPVTPGMPTPGTWHGFAGELAGAYIPSADAFLVGLIWFLIAFALVGIVVVALKYSLEALVHMKRIKQDRLAFFRANWIRYLKLALVRTFVMGFFMLTTLALFQIAIVHGSKGATAIAAVVLVISLLGVGGFIAVGIRTRTRMGKFKLEGDEIILHHAKLFKVLPAIIPVRSSTLRARNLEVQPVATIPFFRIRHINDDPNRLTVHLDEAYIKRFGWLSARFRRTRWWFLAFYAGYQFVRACFLGAAALTPLAQVYGLLVYEIIAFIIMLNLDPFEGSRNTALAIYISSISKILTAGLSIAFLPALNLDRIIATVLGVLIILVQGLTVIAVMILVILSSISTWMSLSRNQEDFEPDWLDAIRIKYFLAMEAKAPDTYQPPKPKPDTKGKGKADDAQPGEVAEPPPPSFAVTSVRRNPKIEDEDEDVDVVRDLDAVHNPSVTFDPVVVYGPTRSHRTSSVSSRHSVSSLRRASGRPHRTSWSSKDFAQWDAMHAERSESELSQRPGSPSDSMLGFTPLKHPTVVALSGAGAGGSSSSLPLNGTSSAPLKGILRSATPTRAKSATPADSGESSALAREIHAEEEEEEVEDRQP